MNKKLGGYLLWAGIGVCMGLLAAMARADDDFYPIPPIYPHSSPVTIVSKAANVDIKTQKVIRIGDINERTQLLFQIQMEATYEIPGDRVLIIHSRGGVVDIGAQMLIALAIEKTATGGRLICVADSDASSMAFNMLSFCDIKLATPKTHFTMHNVFFYQLQSGLDSGTHLTAKNLRKLADEIEQSNTMWRRTNAAALHMDLKDYDLFADEEHTWTVKDLLGHGYLAPLDKFEQ